MTKEVPDPFFRLPFPQYSLELPRVGSILLAICIVIVGMQGSSPATSQQPHATFSSFFSQIREGRRLDTLWQASCLSRPSLFVAIQFQLELCKERMKRKRALLNFYQ